MSIVAYKWVCSNTVEVTEAWRRPNGVTMVFWRSFLWVLCTKKTVWILSYWQVIENYYTLYFLCTLLWFYVFISFSIFLYCFPSSKCKDDNYYINIPYFPFLCFFTKKRKKWQLLYQQPYFPFLSFLFYFSFFLSFLSFQKRNDDNIYTIYY